MQQRLEQNTRMFNELNNNETVTSCLQNLANPDYKVTEGTWEGWPVLAIACYKGYANSAETLVNSGANPQLLIEAKDTWRSWNSLQYAIYYEQFRIANKFIDKLIEQQQAVENFSSGDWIAWSLLAYAIYSDKLYFLDTIKKLLAAGANPNQTFINGKWQGWSLLAYSIYKNHAQFVLMLLEYGADPNQTIPDGSYKGWSLTRYALYQGHNEIALHLAKRGAHGYDILNLSSNSTITANWIVANRYFYRNNLSYAIHHYHRLLQQNANDPFALNALAKSCRIKKKYSTAIEYHERSIAQSSQESKPNQAEFIYEKGYTYFKCGRYQKAYDTAQEAILFNTTNPYFHTLLGCSALKINARNVNLYLNSIEKAIRLNDKIADFYCSKATAMVLLGQYSSSLELCEKAFALDANSHGTFNIQGATYLRLGRIEEAILCFDKAIRMDSNNVYYYNNRANAHYLLGHYANALADFKSAHNLGSTPAFIEDFNLFYIPNLPLFTPELGAHCSEAFVHYYSENHFEKAIQSVESAEKIAPDEIKQTLLKSLRANINMSWGVQLCNQGQFPLAKEKFNAMQRANNDSQEIKYDIPQKIATRTVKLDSHGNYKLELKTNEEQFNNGYLIIFDDKTGEKIADLFIQNKRLALIGYCKNLNLQIEGSLKSFISENINGNFTVSGNIEVEELIQIQCDQLVFRSGNHKAKELQIHTQERLEVSTNCCLSATRNCILSSKKLICDGDVTSDEQVKIEAKDDILVEQKCQIKSKKQAILYAKSIICKGKLEADNHLYLSANDINITHTSQLKSLIQLSVVTNNNLDCEGQLDTSSNLSLKASEYIKIKDRSMLHAKQKLIVMCKLLEVNGKIKSDDVLVLGENKPDSLIHAVDIDRAGTVQSGQIAVYAKKLFSRGKIKSSDAQALLIKETATFALESETTAKHQVIRSNDLNIYGKIDSDEPMILDVENDLTIYQSANLSSKKGIYVTSHNAYVAGILSSLNKIDIRVNGAFVVGNSGTESLLDYGNDLSEFFQSIGNAGANLPGVLSGDENLGKYFSNSNIVIPRLQAEHINIVASLFTNCGRTINGSGSITLACLVDVNAGLFISQNIQKHRILSLDTFGMNYLDIVSLISSVMNADIGKIIDQLFTLEGLTQTASIVTEILKLIFTELRVVLNLVWTVFSIITRLGSIISEIKQLIYKEGPIAFRDVIPILVGIETIAVRAYQTVTLTNLLERNDHEEIWKLTVSDALNRMCNIGSLVDSAENIIALCGPSYTSESLCDLSLFGASATFSLQKRSLLSIEAMNAKAAYFVSQSFCHAYKFGVDAAVNMSISGNYLLQGPGAIVAGRNLQMDLADGWDQLSWGHLVSNNARISVNQLNQAGSIHLSNSQLRVAKHHQIDTTGSFVVNETIEMAGSLHNDGQYKANSGALILEEALTTSETSMLSFTDQLVTASNVILKGKSDFNGKIKEDENNRPQYNSALIVEEHLTIEDNADATFNQSAVKANKITNTARTNLNDKSIMTAEHSIKSESVLNLACSSTLTAPTIELSKIVNNNESLIEANDFLIIRDDALLGLNKAVFRGDVINFNGKIVNARELNQFFANLRFSSSANSLMYGQEGRIEVISHTAKVEGGVYVGRFVLKVNYISNVNDLLGGRGTYAQMQPLESLEVFVPFQVDITDSINRSCGVVLNAKEVHTQAPVASDRDISLIAFDGNTHIGSDIRAGKDLTLASSQDVITNNITFIAGNIMYIEPGRDHHNRKGRGLAREIYITPGHNFENQNGYIKAVNYCYIVPNNVTNNTCIERTEKGVWIRGHENRKKLGNHAQKPVFDPGFIGGGDGEGHDGIGLYIGGKALNNEGSTICSEGDNVFNVENQLRNIAKHASYISNSQKNEKNGRKKYVIETDNAIQQGHIVSTNGKNICESGSIYAVGSVFASRAGADLYTNGPVESYSLITTRKKFTEKEFLGWTYDESSKKFKQALPTVFYDPTSIKIVSLNGIIIARGTEFISDGLVTLKAKEVILERDILTHSMRQKKYSFSIELFGHALLKSIKNKDSFFTAIAQEDALIGKFYSLILSESHAQWLANSWNFVVEFLNSFNSILTGSREGHLGTELLQRYKLGGKNGFDPSFTLTFQHQISRSSFQTLGPGGLTCGDLQVDASKKFVLGNSYPVTVKHDMEVYTDSFIQQGAELVSSNKSQAARASVGFTASGNVTHIGAGFSQSESHDSAHINQSLNVGNKLTVHARNWSQINVSCTLKQLAGHVDKLLQVSQQDRHEASGFSIDVNTSGNIHADIYQDLSAEINHPTIMLVHDGINPTNGPQFTANEIVLVGSRISTEGENNLKPDRVQTTSIKDFRTSRHVGASFNVNHFFARKKPNTSHDANKSRTSTQWIPTINLRGSKNDYRAINQATLFGKEKLSSKKVTRDSTFSMTLDVPVGHQIDFSQARKNYLWASTKIFSKPSDHDTFTLNNESSRLSDSLINQVEDTDKIHDELPEQIHGHSIWRTSYELIELTYDSLIHKFIQKFDNIPGKSAISLTLKQPVYALNFAFNYMEEHPESNPNAWRNAGIGTLTKGLVGYAFGRLFGPMAIPASIEIMAGQYYASNPESLSQFRSLAQDISMSRSSESGSLFEKFGWYQLRHDIIEAETGIGVAEIIGSTYEALENWPRDKIIELIDANNTVDSNINTRLGR